MRNDRTEEGVLIFKVRIPEGSAAAQGLKREQGELRSPGTLVRMFLEKFYGTFGPDADLLSVPYRLTQQGVEHPAPSMPKQAPSLPAPVSPPPQGKEKVTKAPSVIKSSNMTGRTGNFGGFLDE